LFSILALCFSFLDPPTLEKIGVADLFSKKQEGVVIKDLTGNEFKWNDFKGRVAFVNIWATWCSHCVEELPSMARLYKKFADNPDNIIFIFYSDESYSKLKRFNNKNKTGVPICYSKSGKFPLKEHNDKHSGGSVPATYIIGRDGEEIYHCLDGADWDDEKVVELINELLKK